MSLEPIQLYVLLGVALLIGGWIVVQVARFHPERALFHREVVELRRGRYLTAGILLAVITITCLGVPAVPEAAWDTGWWLYWERTPSDWVLMVEISAVVLAGLAAWCVLPDTGWYSERRNIRRYQVTVLANEAYLRERQLSSMPDAVRPARIDKLVRTYPDTWRSGQWEVVRRVHAGEDLYVPRFGVGRRRLLWDLTRQVVVQADRGKHHFAVSTWSGTVRHEAGHAVINASFGNRVLHVYVMEKGRGETVHAPRLPHPEDGFVPDHQHWLQGRWERMVALFGGIIMDRKHGGQGFQDTGSLPDLQKVMECAHDLYGRGALLDDAVPDDGVAGWISAGYSEASDILATTTVAQEQTVAALNAKRDGHRSVLGVYDLAPLLDDIPCRPNRVSAST